MPASIKNKFFNCKCKNVTNSSVYKNNKPFDIFDRDEHKNSNVQSMLSTLLSIVFESQELFLIVERLIPRHQQAIFLLLPLSLLLLHLLLKRKVEILP